MSDDWVPKKLEVHVDVPDELDLGSLRSSGVQPGEQLQPEAAPGATHAAAAPPPPGVQPSQEIVDQLVAMGFSANGSKRAAVAVQVRG